MIITKFEIACLILDISIIVYIPSHLIVFSHDIYKRTSIAKPVNFLA